MKTYVVKSRITGKRNRTFEPGETIAEADIAGNVVQSLISRGFIVDTSVQQPPITGKIKLAIVTSVWKRADVFRMFCMGIEQLILKCKEFEINLIVSGSEQNENRLVTHKEIDSYIHFLSFNYDIKTKYIEIPNEPLAAKVNATTYACKNLGVHYVLCMGSDDIISPELLNEYSKYMRKGIDFIGITDCYFYDTVSNQSLYWGGYRASHNKGHTTGAFRALSARLLSQWDWMPWENKHSHILDTSMQNKLKETPHSIHTFSCKEKGMFALDIKSSTNMTPFKKWDNAEFIDNEIIKKQFPYIF